MYTAEELFQRVCNGETLDAEQREMLRRELVFAGPFTMSVVGSDKIVEKLRESTIPLHIQYYPETYSENAADCVRKLERECPDIICFDCDDDIAYRCFELMPSDMLRRSVVLTLSGQHRPDMLRRFWSEDIDAIMLSGEWILWEIIRKLKDMLIYKRCCSLKGSAFDYRDCTAVYTDSCKTNLLIVDKILKSQLKIDIVALSTNAEVLEYISRNRDILLMTDILRENPGGLKFMQKLHEYDKAIPFMFISACIMYKAEAYRIGASEFIGKPMLMEYMVPKIRFQLRLQQCMSVYRRIMGVE